MTAETLLSRCRDLGVIVALSPEGKLRATPPGKLPEDLKAQIRQHKAAVLAALCATPITLRCRQCNREAQPDTGTLSVDGTGYIQFWRCLSCGAKGSTVFRLQ